MALNSGEAIRMDEFAMDPFPLSRLPVTPCGRLEMIQTLCMPQPIVDEDGEPTGEYAEPVLSTEDAKRLLAKLLP